MAFNGFQQHKIKGLRYYCGLIIKSKNNNNNDLDIED